MEDSEPCTHTKPGPTQPTQRVNQNKDDVDGNDYCSDEDLTQSWSLQRLRGIPDISDGVNDAIPGGFPASQDSPIKMNHASPSLQNDHEIDSEKPPEVEFKSCFLHSTAFWRDNIGEVKSLSHLRLDAVVDTLKTNKAILKLSRSFHLQYQERRRDPELIFLYLYPNVIRTISFELQDSVPLLHFALNANLALIAPSDFIVSEPEIEGVLRPIRGLATATDFTIRIDPSVIAKATHMRLHLQQIASIFSSTHTQHRPTTHYIGNDLKSLYRGLGGRVIDVGTLGQPEFPPPYQDVPTPGARKGTRNREPEKSKPGSERSHGHVDAVRQSNVRKEASDVQQSSKGVHLRVSNQDMKENVYRAFEDILEPFREGLLDDCMEWQRHTTSLVHSDFRKMRRQLIESLEKDLMKIKERFKEELQEERTQSLIKLHKASWKQARPSQKQRVEMWAKRMRDRKKIKQQEQALQEKERVIQKQKQDWQRAMDVLKQQRSLWRSQKRALQKKVKAMQKKLKAMQTSRS